MNSSENIHKPVLLNEVLEALSSDSAVNCFVDCTLGGGGHLRAYLEKFERPKKIYAFDQDIKVLSETSKKFEEEVSIQFIHDNFSSFAQHIQLPVDRVLVDLGVSSFQLDDPERGFSFQKDGPLDMRMNTSKGQTASEWLSQVGEKELADTIFTYGQERRSRLIARRIVTERKSRRISSTKELVECLGFKLDSKNRMGRHPLTKVFQAIRIFINDELNHLESFLEQIPAAMAPGGRLAIISFQSMEDRLVKHRLKGRLKPVNKKVIMASEEESSNNPRSRSAKLRIYSRD